MQENNNTQGAQPEDFTVQCDVCGQYYQNWVGSTPCCGSIAYKVDEQGNKTSTFILFGKIEPVKSAKDE